MIVHCHHPNIRQYRFAEHDEKLLDLSLNWKQHKHVQTRTRHTLGHGRRHTACRVGACQDRAAGDVGTFADEVVVFLALRDRSLGTFTVDTSQSNRQILKQYLRSW